MKFLKVVVDELPNTCAKCAFCFWSNGIGCLETYFDCRADVWHDNREKINLYGNFNPCAMRHKDCILAVESKPKIKAFRNIPIDKER